MEQAEHVLAGAVSQSADTAAGKGDKQPFGLQKTQAENLHRTLTTKLDETHTTFNTDLQFVGTKLTELHGVGEEGRKVLEGGPFVTYQECDQAVTKATRYIKTITTVDLAGKEQELKQVSTALQVKTIAGEMNRSRNRTKMTV